MAEGKSIQAMGGEARAKALSVEQLSDSGRTAALVRWAKKRAPIPKATHEGVMHIGDAEISCAVLEGGIRVISEREVTKALGGKRGGSHWLRMKENPDGAVLPVYLSANNLKPLITKDLEVALKPLIYEPISGGRAHGLRAEMLPKVCNLLLRARDEKTLHQRQAHLAAQAEILVRAFAELGIIGLVDEATGFQYDRPRRDLEEQLKKFLSENLRRWVRTFPADYFKHLCRLRGVELRPDVKLPQYFGHLTNNLVYRRLAPGLLKMLKERREERGSKSNKLHSWLSEDVGFRGVLVHLGTVVGLMKLHTDYDAFEKQLDQIAPVYPNSPGLFDDPKDWEAPV